MMKQPIFITARFRTGSTLLWNIFRQVPEVVAYYEPLHEKLPQMIRSNIQPQPTHDFVTRYFDEYPAIETLPHASEFGVHRLYLSAEEDHPQLKAYIQALINCPEATKTPVLQFNRVDFRLAWLKANFPTIPIVHLFRSPREQWLSSITGNAAFSETDLDSDPYLITTWARDLCQQFPFLASPWIRHPYQRHYYLWKLSYLAGARQSDRSISYEMLLAEPEMIVSQLLETANLEVATHLENCLSVIVQKPTCKWKTYRDESWFLALEQDCESLLDRLGLNQDFGQKPLTEIVSNSAEYQALCNQSQVRTWQIQSSQTHAIALENLAEEKEEIIAQLHTIAEERLTLLTESQQSLQEKDQAIAQLKTIAEERSHLISRLEQLQQVREQDFDRELTLKEAAMTDLKAIAEERVEVMTQLEQDLITKQNYLDAMLGFHYGKESLTLEKRLRIFLRKLGFKLPASYRYIWDQECSPIPLQLPKHYYKTSLKAKKDLPTVSIVTPSYNHAVYLERTIKSVLEQNYPKLEYIVQDGGSKDGTAEILDQYRDRLAHVESRSDKGQSHALNLGFRHATGDIMAYLNSDDVLLPGAIATVVNYFQRHPEVDVVYGHRILIDENDQDIGRWVLPPQTHQPLKWADYIPQETLFWRRRIWDAVGGSINESFQYAMDWELLLRFEQAGAKFARVPRFLGAFRKYPAQKTIAWHSIGEQEVMKLRQQYHHRLVTQIEVEHWVRPLVEQMRLYYRLYYLGILRY